MKLTTNCMACSLTYPVVGEEEEGSAVAPSGVPDFVVYQPEHIAMLYRLVGTDLCLYCNTLLRELQQ